MKVKCYYCKNLFLSGECIKVGHRAYEGCWLCHPCYEEYMIKENERDKKMNDDFEERKKQFDKNFEETEKELTCNGCGVIKKDSFMNRMNKYKGGKVYCSNCQWDRRIENRRIENKHFSSPITIFMTLLILLAIIIGIFYLINR